MQEIKKCAELICVDYPGKVDNVSNMVETLGGAHTVSEVLCDPTRKLQLRFRPNDRLSPPITSLRKTSNALLIKVRIKKKSQKVVSYEIIGHVREELSFSSPCDFQYLAMENGINVYDKTFPTGLNPDWLKGDGPKFLTPVCFSRSDIFHGYYFAPDKEKTSTMVDKMPLVSTTGRKRRFGIARFLNFEDEEVPLAIKQSPFSNAPVNKTICQKSVLKLQKLFEERPVFSRSAMAGVSGIPEKTLKELAPYVAYHFHNGPWRAMWVRFGYDPRKDPSARIYQTIDFRFHRADDDSLEKLGRSLGVPRTKTKSTVGDEINSDKYILTPGKLPPSRQFFYQYCDVKLPEVEATLATAEVRQECHPTDGWLPEGTAFACRRVMKNYVMEALGQPKDTAEISDYSASTDGQDSDDSDVSKFLPPNDKSNN